MDAQSSQLTPEQIKAYSDVGADIYSCLSVGGPPPIGSFVIYTWPKGRTPPPMVFGANCQIMGR